MDNDYFESDEFKEVLEQYEASVQSDTYCYLDAEDFADIADFYLTKGRADDGLDACEKGLFLHPDSRFLMSVKSGILIYKHEYEDARLIIDSFDDAHCSNDVYYQKAQLKYALEKDVDTAEEMFREWIEREKNQEVSCGNREDSALVRDSYIHVITSFIELCDKGRYDDELVKRWVEEYVVLFAPLGEYEEDLLLADIVRDEGLTDMIEKVYSSILETNPYANCGWTVLATAQSINGHYHESLESCDFALAVNPDDWDAKLTRAHDYYSLGDTATALPMFEEIMKVHDDHSQSLPYAICLVSQKRLDEAAVQLEYAAQFVDSVLDQDSSFYANAYYEIGETYFVLMNYEKGHECIDKSLALYPDNPDYHMCKGTLYLGEGNMDDAVSEFALAISDTNDKALASLYVSINLIAKGADELAIPILDSCYTMADQNLMVQTSVPGYKCLAYFHLGDTENFMKELEKACNTCPNVLRDVFGNIFPQEVKPEDYYQYVINNPLDFFGGQ